MTISNALVRLSKCFCWCVLVGTLSAMGAARAQVACPNLNPNPNLRITNDFNADCKSELVWRNIDGSNVLWYMNGTALTSSAFLLSVPDSWSIVGSGDFNGDGRTDFLWRASDGTVAIWLMNNTTISSGTVLMTVPADWDVVGVGDFDGDGKSDILWRAMDGSVAIWLMNGTSISSSAVIANVALNWVVAGVGDFNGDGRSDILWRASDGSVAIWTMNGISFSGSLIANVPTSWTIPAVGDFNGDGKADIFWRNSDGDNAIWLMNGTAVSSTALINNVPVNWVPQGPGDVNGDGRADLVWREIIDGHVALWLMNGTTITSSGVPVAVADFAWQMRLGITPTSVAVYGAKSGAYELFSVTNARGNDLAASDLTPFFDSGYVNDSFGVSFETANFADLFRGAAVHAFSSDRVLSDDPFNRTIAILPRLIFTPSGGGAPILSLADPTLGGAGFKRHADGKWYFFGNQRPAQVRIDVEMRTDQLPGPTAGTESKTGPRQHINVDVRALQGNVSSASITGGGVFNNTNIPAAGTDVLTRFDTRDTTATFIRDIFVTASEGAVLPETPFTVTLTGSGGGTITTRTQHVPTTDMGLALTSPTSAQHALANANVGGTRNAAWTLPAYPIAELKLQGYVKNGVGQQCEIDETVLAPSATSGSINIPSSCNSAAITEVGLNLFAEGTQGERSIIIYVFR